METVDGQPPQHPPEQPLQIPQKEEPIPPPQERREREIRRAFQGVAATIHTTLVKHYQIREADACDLEKDLFVWFERFCRRPGDFPVSESVPFLLLACCQFAVEYKKFVLTSDAIAASKKLRQVLAREPGRVARAMARLLKLRFRNPDV